MLMVSHLKKLIVYDLDGTLADTRKDIVLGVNHMLEALAAPPLDAREIEGYVGRGLRELVRSALKADDAKLIEKGAKIFRRYYAEHMLDHTCLYEGVREVLEYFRDRKQAVMTNKPNPFSKKMLEALGIRRYFTAVIAGEPGRPQKPDPSLLLELMEREGVSPAEALFIGDSPIDIETARRAGIEVVVITHGFTAEDALKSFSPDRLVRSFEEILPEAARRGW